MRDNTYHMLKEVRFMGYPRDEGCGLLLFFLLLVIIFCNSGCFGDGCELLFFFLILVVLFCGCGGLGGGLCGLGNTE
jgi:hypothetical protein